VVPYAHAGHHGERSSLIRYDEFAQIPAAAKLPISFFGTSGDACRGSLSQSPDDNPNVVGLMAWYDAGVLSSGQMVARGRPALSRLRPKTSDALPDPPLVIFVSTTSTRSLVEGCRKRLALSQTLWARHDDQAVVVAMADRALPARGRPADGLAQQGWRERAFSWL
jgi:hypothetical protein